MKHGQRPAYLESKNNGPDESKGEPGVSVYNVMSTHVLQVHPLLVEKCQRLVDVLEAVNTHFAFRWVRLKEYVTKCHEREMAAKRDPLIP